MGHPFWSQAENINEVVAVIDPDLLDPDRRRANGLDPSQDVTASMIVEVDNRYIGGAEAAGENFARLHRQVAPGGQIEPLSLGYWRCDLSLENIVDLILLDMKTSLSNRCIKFVWTDFVVRPMLDVSSKVIKAPTARTIFDADGSGINWAVVDSGIDSQHPHFQTFDTLGGDVSHLHRSFVPSSDDPLIDASGHGSHVAGIIAGGLSNDGNTAQLRVGEHLSLAAELSEAEVETRARLLQDLDTRLKQVDMREKPRIRPDAFTQIMGIAPRAKLVSLRVLDRANSGRASDVIAALNYVRTTVNEAEIRISGVNISIGHGFNAKSFACGHTPLCVEVNRLVDSGVVVVAAAGNTGFMDTGGDRDAAVMCSIQDPGNADGAITVGSTHRSTPHRHGVSHFSSKGPTIDGRLKPDLVAPGERITSCAAGKEGAAVLSLVYESPESALPTAPYIDATGTSAAAPHVSGAVAAFLSVRAEFVGQPLKVKERFMASAIPLGRDRYFEGCGLVNLLGALQSV